jgi:hypothetical protein
MKRAKPFSVADALARAAQILAAPPAKPHIVRQAAEGDLVARFALPLELCVPQNRKANVAAWRKAARTRDSILRSYALQLRGKLPNEPLGGRPIVECVRFSSVEGDAFQDSFKTPVDCLCPSRLRIYQGRQKRIAGLGLIVDDRPACVDLRQRWEYAPRGEGFCIVSVYSGGLVK